MFSARRETMLEGLRKPTELIVIVVTLLAYGCPIPDRYNFPGPRFTSSATSSGHLTAFRVAL